MTAVAGVGQVVVSWPESQTSSTQKVTGYEVQVSTDSGGTWAGAGTGCAKDTTTKSTALTCTATGLAAGTYSFRIATLKKNPNTKATKTTDFSAGSTGVTVVAAPGAPAQPTAVAGDGKATVTVADGKLGGTPTWYTVTAVNASGKSCTVTGASGSCPVTGLTNGTAYTFTATATNTTGTSGASPASGSAIPAAAATSTTTGPANRGYVLWFNDSKRFGYITPYDGGENLYAHFSAINMAGYKTLTAGQCVKFEKTQANGVLNASTIQDAPCWP